SPLHRGRRDDRIARAARNERVPAHHPVRASPPGHLLKTKERSPMALVSMRQLLDHAAEHGYGLPAFNVNNLEQVQAVMEAAQEVESAAILQISAGARKYAGEPFIRHLMLAALEMFPGVPLA